MEIEKSQTNNILFSFHYFFSNDDNLVNLVGCKIRLNEWMNENE